MTTRTQNRENFDELLWLIDPMRATFNAKVTYVENGEHKAGKPVELNLGEPYMMGNK